MNYYTLLKSFRDILNANPNIKTITEGSLDDIDASKKDIYPLAHLIIDSGLENENLTFWNVSLQCVDVVTDNNEPEDDKFIGNDNEQDVYNTMHNVIRRTFRKFLEDTEDDLITVQDGAPTQKVDNKQNNIVGWQIDLVVEVPDNLMSVC
jgi:hypothetical protein